MAFPISDYSEFQGEVHPNGQAVVIIRAYNGFRADNYWAVNRRDAHAAGCPAVGIYAYLTASRDAAQQARELCDLIGTLAPNEWLICDLEEGGGNEQPRWAAWNAVCFNRFSRLQWLYSGLSFAQAHNLTPDWVAAYQGNEPQTPYPHKLWQNTDAYPWPWGHGDGSIYDGTLAQFLVAAGITNVPIVQPPTRRSNTMILFKEFNVGNSGSVGPAVFVRSNGGANVRWLENPADLDDVIFEMQQCGLPTNIWTARQGYRLIGGGFTGPDPVPNKVIT